MTWLLLNTTLASLPSPSAAQAWLGVFGLAFIGVIGWVTRTVGGWRKAYVEQTRERLRTEQFLETISELTKIPVAELSVLAIIETYKTLSAGEEKRGILESLVRALPPPYIFWVKQRLSDGSYVMVECNEHFANLFLGGPAESYAGQPDGAVFPPHITEIYRMNDEKVFEFKGPLEVSEPVDAPATGAKGWANTTKFYHRAIDKDLVGGIGVFEPE